MNSGGYDSGYRACPCFWGKEPGTLVRLVSEKYSIQGMRVLDLGCGEGKNAVYFSALGAEVTAIDISEVAIKRAHELWPKNSVTWKVADVRTAALDGVYDLIIAYGLLHCLTSEGDVNFAIKRIQTATAPGGLNIVVALNGRIRDLRAHPDLNPCWLAHEWYTSRYKDWSMIVCSDSDLTEVHPHNNIIHTHSITRILASKDVL